MKEKDKNSKVKLADMLRYNSDKLSGREKNSIEREFQKDPFAEEAAEGFSSIGQDEAISDFHSLERSLSSRISGGKRVIWYRIAASVAILMAISSLFFLLNREKTTPAVNEIALNNPVDKITEPKTVAIPEKQLTEAAKVEKKAISKERKAVPAKDMVSQDEAVIARSEIYDVQVPMAAVKSENLDLAQSIPDSGVSEISSRAKAAAPSGAGKRMQLTAMTYKGRVISADDSSPVAGATIIDKSSSQATITDLEGRFSIDVKKQEEPTFIASYIGMETKEFKAKTDTGLNVVLTPSLANLSEVVVVGYGVSDKANAEEQTVGTDNQLIPPEPEGGRKSFDSYLRENKINPDTTLAEKRKLVVIKFTVTAKGNIQNIRITKTPGTAYSEEAKRLVLNGPSWKPAKRNGVLIDDDVTLRISFK
jgi:outer membrane biosynthesis protein TonB